MHHELIVADLGQAVSRLEDALRSPADTDLLRAGCIQYFEFTFELAWKAIKAVAESEGVQECVSPKNALKHAFARGWIDDEHAWLEMLAARNRMSHVYNAEQSRDVYEALPRFLSPLRQLASRLAQVT